MILSDSKLSKRKTHAVNKVRLATIEAQVLCLYKCKTGFDNYKTRLSILERFAWSHWIRNKEIYFWC